MNKINKEKIKLVDESKILNSLDAKNVRLNLKQSVTKINATFTIEITNVPVNISKSEKSLLQSILRMNINKFMVMPNLAQNIPYKKGIKNNGFKVVSNDNRIDNRMVSQNQIDLWVNVCKGSRKDLLGKSMKWVSDNLITPCIKERQKKWKK